MAQNDHVCAIYLHLCASDIEEGLTMNRQDDFMITKLATPTSLIRFLIATGLGGLIGAAILLLPSTYEARGKLVQSSIWVESDEFQRAFLGSASLKKLQFERYLGKGNDVILIPGDLELRIRDDNLITAQKLVAETLEKIATEIRQDITRKYQAEASALALLAAKNLDQASELNINIDGILSQRQVQVELVLTELKSEDALVNVWLKEPVLHFPKPNLVIGVGLLAGAIIGTLLNLIIGLPRRQ